MDQYVGLIKHFQDEAIRKFPANAEPKPAPAPAQEAPETLFEAKPQRYLIDGEREIPITDGMNLSNPTRFEAKPVILASAASGTVRIQMGGVTIAFSGDGYTRRIDCETGNCYRLSSGEIYPANGDVTLTGGYDFPGLQPGGNTIRISGGSGTIIPRWFEL